MSMDKFVITDTEDSISISVSDEDIPAFYRILGAAWHNYEDMDAWEKRFPGIKADLEKLMKSLYNKA